MNSSQKRQAYTPRKSAYDADPLLLQLSIFGFSKLCVSDQHFHTEEIQKKIVENVVVVQLPKETDEGFRARTFTELLKKLPFAYKSQFLSKVIQKFKSERQFAELVSSFKQLNARDQQNVIRTVVRVTPDQNLQIPGESDWDFRLRRFTQMSRDYTDHVYKCFHKCLPKRKYKTSGDDGILFVKMQSRFFDFVFGFTTIWFQGQSTEVQKEMIQLFGGSGDKDVTIKKRLRGESEEDYQLRSFTNLYFKKAIDFDAQVHFLDTAERKLLRQGKDPPHGRLLLPQDSDSAGKLLSTLSTFGFSLLFEKDQRDMIEEISKEVQENDQGQVATEETEESFRMRRFKEIFNKLQVHSRIELFDKFTSKFFGERRLCESILLFRHLSSHEQTELLQSLLDRIMKLYPPRQTFDFMVDKSMEQSEEDFRLTKFKKIYGAEPSYVWNLFSYPEAEKLGPKATMQLHTSENKEIHEIQQSRFAECFMGFAVIWFKARCANHPRNPVDVLLSSEFYEVDDASEKLIDETLEDFRLRRFRESFEKLEFYSRECIIRNIEVALCHDLGYTPINYGDHGSRQPLPRGLFHPEFIKLRSGGLGTSIQLIQTRQCSQ